MPRLSATIAALCLLAACSQRPTHVAAPTDVARADAGTAITFATPDGVMLTGRVFGNGRAGVALAHMYPSDATSWYPTARKLASLGYRALAFNFRGYDGSKGARSPAKAPVDLRAADEYLRAQGAQTVALVGASMGGTAALIVAPDLDPPAVVAVSAPTSFQGMDAQSAAPNVKAPVLLLAARDDPSNAAESLRTLSGLLPSAEAKLFDGEAHGTKLLDERPEATDEIVTFLHAHAPA